MFDISSIESIRLPSGVTDPYDEAGYERNPKRRTERFQSRQQRKYHKKPQPGSLSYLRRLVSSSDESAIRGAIDSAMTGMKSGYRASFDEPIPSFSSSLLSPNALRSLFNVGFRTNSGNLNADLARFNSKIGEYRAELLKHPQKLNAEIGRFAVLHAPGSKTGSEHFVMADITNEAGDVLLSESQGLMAKLVDQDPEGISLMPAHITLARTSSDSAAHSLKSRLDSSDLAGYVVELGLPTPKPIAIQ